MIKIELLTLKDIFIVPICLIFLTTITYCWANKYYKRAAIKKYIFPAFGLRMLGCILTALMYQYYYATPDDSFKYYETAITIHQVIEENPLEGLDILVSPISDFTPQQWNLLNKHSRYFKKEGDVLSYKSLMHGNPIKKVFLYESNTLLSRTGAVLSIFTLKSYLGIGLFLAYFSFLGCWKLYILFQQIYPHLYKNLAIAILFMPSLCFWGAAGLMKETLIVGALGYLVYNMYQMLNKKCTPSVFFACIIYFLIATISKIYIGMILIPALLAWLFMQYKAKFKSIYIQIAVVLILCIICYLGIYIISKDNDRFNLGNLLNYAFNFQEKGGGSAYSLGEMQPNFWFLLIKIPESLNVALFRPYLWEVNKGIMLPMALESLLLLIATIYIIRLKMRQFNRKGSVKWITPEIMFCLVFCFLLFFIVGFTSFNFGTLARYRMLGLPFYGIILSVISQVEGSKGYINEKV